MEVNGFIVMGPVAVLIAASWIRIALGKRAGDALATWVIGNEEDDSLTPEFGIDWVDVGQGKQRASLRAYRYYAKRYRQLRRERGEDTGLARRFTLIDRSNYVIVGLLIIHFVFMAMVLPWR